MERFSQNSFLERLSQTTSHTDNIGKLKIIQIEYEQLTSDHENLLTVAAEFEKQIQQLKFENENLKNIIDNERAFFNNKLKDLVQENERLNIVTNEYYQQKDNLDNLYTNYENAQLELQNANMQIQSLQQDLFEALNERREVEKQKARLSIVKQQEEQALVEEKQKLEQNLQKNESLLENISNRLRELTEQNDKSSHIINELEKENEMLNQQLNETEEKCQQLEADNLNFAQKLKQNLEVLEAIQQQIPLFENENKRLNDQNIELIQMQNAIQQSNMQLQEQLNEERGSLLDRLAQQAAEQALEQEKLKKQYEVSIKNALEKEISDIQAKFKQDKKTQDELLKQLNKKLQDEIQKNVSNKLEVDNWREKIKKIEEQRQEELRELQEQLETIKQNQLYSQNQEEFQAERVIYETTIDQIKNRLQQMELLNIQLIKEQEELKINNSQKIIEIENLKNSLRSIQNLNSNYKDQLYNENDKLRSQNLDLKEDIMKLNNNLKIQETQLQQQEMMIDSLKNDLLRSYEIIEERKKETGEVQQKSDYLKAELRRLSELEKGGQFSLIQQEKFQVMMREIEELTISRDNYKSQAERNTLEMTQKSKLLLEKIQEMDALKLKYQESINNVHHLELKLLEKLQQGEIVIY